MDVKKPTWKIGLSVALLFSCHVLADKVLFTGEWNIYTPAFRDHLSTIGHTVHLELDTTLLTASQLSNYDIVYRFDKTPLSPEEQILYIDYLNGNKALMLMGDSYNMESLNLSIFDFINGLDGVIAGPSDTSRINATGNMVDPLFGEALGFATGGTVDSIGSGTSIVKTPIGRDAGAIYQLPLARVAFSLDFDQVNTGATPDPNYTYHTQLLEEMSIPDTDADGVPDDIELQDGSDPDNGSSFKDSDNGGVPDYIEINIFNPSTDILNPSDDDLSAYYQHLLDSDGDGVPDSIEVQQGTDPNVESDYLDTDGDGVPDAVEVIDGTNPELATSYKDSDTGGMPDYVEAQLNLVEIDPTDDFSQDTDGDGVPDGVEQLEGTDPNNSADYSGLDTDGDGVPDVVEQLEGSDLNDASSYQDSDNGGLADYLEIQLGLNPNQKEDDLTTDTDGDGVPDGVELLQGTDHNNSNDFTDTDGDGVPDAVEVLDGTNPNDATSFKDSDNGGLPNYIELQIGQDPTVSTDDFTTDTDGDGVPDGVELLEGTNLNDGSDFRGIDSDGDGVPDVIEIIEGTNPNDASSVKNSDGGSLPDYLERLIGLNPFDISDDPLVDENEVTSTSIVAGRSGGSTSMFVIGLLALLLGVRRDKEINK